MLPEAEQAAAGHDASRGQRLHTARARGRPFVDIGTLVPFLAGYTAITGMDPAGVLLGFGVFGGTLWLSCRRGWLYP